MYILASFVKDKVKRQLLEWEKIIANEAMDKELISKMYRQLLQLNSRKIKDPIKKWAKELMLSNCSVGEKTLESPLDNKEIKPVNLKGNQP